MTCVRQEADLSCAELGAESPDGARKNSARLSRRRENPRFKHTLRMVLKSGLESRTHITTLIHTPAGALTHRTSRGRVPVQHVPGLVQQSDGDNVVFRQPTRLSRRQQPSVCLCISVCVRVRVHVATWLASASSSSASRYRTSGRPAAASTSALIQLSCCSSSSRDRFCLRDTLDTDRQPINV